MTKPKEQSPSSFIRLTNQTDSGYNKGRLRGKTDVMYEADRINAKIIELNKTYESVKAAANFLIWTKEKIISSKK